MKRWWFLIFFLLIFISFVYAKDCVICNGNSVVAYYDCPALKTCSNCIDNNKFSSSAVLQNCDTSSCYKCYDPVGADARCKSDCSSSQVCSSGVCCKPNGATCVSDASCCSGECKKSKCVEPCTPNWQCTDWSTCISNKQTRTCTDTNNCGVSTGKPSETQTCQAICTPNWQCTSWSDCVDGKQTRTCTDSNSCGVDTGRPSETQTCNLKCNGCMDGKVCKPGNTDSKCGVGGGPCQTCPSGTSCVSGECLPSGGSVTYSITNKKKIYNIGDQITSVWSLPSYAYTASGCTVHFLVNGGVDEDFYVYCGDPGLNANGDTGTLTVAHCYGKSGTITNKVQMVIKDSSGKDLAKSGTDSYKLNCVAGACTPNCAGKECGDDGCGGSCGTCSSGKTCSNGQCVTSGACKKQNEICKSSSDCCSGLSCFQTYEGYQRVYKCLPEQTGCNKYNFVGGSTNPTSGGIGSKFTIKCDYGAKIDCIYPISYVAGGSCKWTGFEGTVAVFDCTAQNPGNYINYCHLGLNTNDKCCESYDAAGSINTGQTFRCTCDAATCGWEKCTAADVGKTMCKVGWIYMGPHYNEVRKCMYSDEDGCYLYLPVEDCNQKANSGCALNTKTGKHECICSMPCTPNEKRCAQTIKYISPLPPGDWVIQQCNANGCGWKDVEYCDRDQECDATTKTCKTKPCPYCCPSGMTCTSPSGGVGCTSGTCCSSASACTTCADECNIPSSRQCFGAYAYQICGNHDADSCLEWSSSINCPTGQSCSGAGVCGATCQNQCSSGSKQCFNSTAYQDCVLFGSCYGWGSPISCPSGQSCTNGVCSSGVSCPNGVCTAGENCPADASSCPDNKCYEPTCTNGCGQNAVASGQTDEACYGNVGCGSGSRELVHKGLLFDDSNALLKNPQGVFVSGNYAYITNGQNFINYNYEDGGLEVVDVSNPSVPVHYGKLITVMSTPEKILVQGNYAYLLSAFQGLEVVSVSNPSHPVHISKLVDDSTTLLGSPLDMFISGNYVYILNYGNYQGNLVIEPTGIEIVSVSNPSNPVHAGKIETHPMFLKKIFISGNYLYGAGWESGTPSQPVFVVYDISTPSNPIRVSKLYGNSQNNMGHVQDIFVSGGYAYLTSMTYYAGQQEDGVTIISVSNPSNPVFVGKIMESPTTALYNPSFIRVNEGYAYVFAGESAPQSYPYPRGITILDVSNPSSPTQVGKLFSNSIPVVNGTVDMFVLGNHIYTVDRSGALEILGISSSGSGINCKCNGAGQCVSGGGVTYSASSNVVSLNDFRSALNKGIASYFSNNPILTDAEIKDFIATYFGSVDLVDLSATGTYSGEKLLDIYNKIITSTGAGYAECLLSSECVKCGNSCIHYNQWSAVCASPTMEFECVCDSGVCKKS